VLCVAESLGGGGREEERENWRDLNLALVSSWNV
jgi:hypothetical protein